MIKILTLSTIFLLVHSNLNAQIKSRSVVKSTLPKIVAFKGKVNQAIQFQDNTGSYLTFNTQTGEQPQKGDDQFKQAHLYAYLYQNKGNGLYTPIWQLHDFIANCDLDIKAQIIPGSLTVTDLNKNGKAEVWIAYRLSCSGDISPSELKVVMQEQKLKFLKHGIGKIKIGKAHQPDGGEVISDQFKKAPISFKQYADKLWNKYLVEIN
jgi:hypothetical protein